MTDRRIITDCDPKPIPIRQFDWSASRDDDNDGESVGYGATEEAAIADLLELESEQ